MAHIVTPRMVWLARISHGQNKDPWPGTFGKFVYARQLRVSGLLQRGGWDCHWCGKPMLENAPKIPRPLGRTKGHSVHPQELTVEHLTRRADGGLNDWDNLALAHYACNVARNTPETRAIDRARETARPERRSHMRCAKIVGGMWKGAHTIPPLPKHEDGLAAIAPQSGKAAELCPVGA